MSTLPLTSPFLAAAHRRPSLAVAVPTPPRVRLPSPASRAWRPLRASGSGEGGPSSPAAVTVESSDSGGATLFVIRSHTRIGLLQVIAGVFGALGLRIDSASVEFDGEFFVKRFFVTDSEGKRIDDDESLERIRGALADAVKDDGEVSVVGPATRGVVVRKLGPELGSDQESRAKAERMFALMDGYLKNDPISLQKDILNHVEYTVARSRFNFDDFEAYQVRKRRDLFFLFFSYYDSEFPFLTIDFSVLPRFRQNQFNIIHILFFLGAL